MALKYNLQLHRKNVEDFETVYLVFMKKLQ